jgi:tyrosyl-tRNA synthetase
MYGKALSIPDELIYPYFELVTDLPVSTLPDIKERAEKDPRNTKHELAFTITRMYHGEEAAKMAKEHFEKTVIKKDIPDDAPVFTFDTGVEMRLLDIIGDAGLTSSNGETKRMMKQGGVSLNDEKIKEPRFSMTFAPGDEYDLKVGKRKFARLTANS